MQPNKYDLDVTITQTDGLLEVIYLTGTWDELQKEIKILYEDNTTASTYSFVFRKKDDLVLS